MICCRMSGEALTRNQFSPSALTASDACVPLSCGLSQAARQVGQLQFHCGNPPPAAVPSTTMVNMSVFRIVRLAEGPIAYFCFAQAYMLISMPTGTSETLGAFQAIEHSPFVRRPSCRRH